MKKVLLGSFVLFALPFVAAAQTLTNITSLVASIGNIVYILIPILIGVAIIVFFFGLVKYIWGAKGEDSSAEGRRIMLAGIISLFIMVSIWGIIQFAQSALGISGANAALPTPTVQGLQ
jgi:hypothetical protein